MLFSRNSVLWLLLLNFLDLCSAVGCVAGIAGTINIADITDVICRDNI